MKSEYRRRLPHIFPADAHVFLTWRLAGSIPAAHTCERRLTPGQKFVAEDRALDRSCQGTLWLRDPRIAAIVADAIHMGAEERGFYELVAWVIMANHVHLLILPKVPVCQITRWLKGSTARSANVLLGQTGERFWRDESYDHWVRNPEELARITRYIEGNPVAAGLVDEPEQYLWSSAYNPAAGKPLTRLAG
jgi:REP element-mobilizing transposase RayT